MVTTYAWTFLAPDQTRMTLRNLQVTFNELGIDHIVDQAAPSDSVVSASQRTEDVPGPWIGESMMLVRWRTGQLPSSTDPASSSRQVTSYAV